MAKVVSKEMRRVLRCFCNCSELTEDDVRHLYRLDPSGTLIDQRGARMLRSFLRQKYPNGGESVTQVEIYEKCSEYLMMMRIPAMTELDDLDELGLSYRLVRDLKEHIKTADRMEIDGCLTRIQGECCRVLEESEDFREYKREILKKLQSLE